MSSTNRSNARDTHVSDYYITPQDCIRDFLVAWLSDTNRLPHEFEKLDILDPCAGGDEHYPMSYPTVFYQELGNKPDTLDIREDSRADIKTDYLKYDAPKNKYDIIITNPPFNIAREIIEKALRDVKHNGYVIMLLRLNFFGSKARRDLWNNQMPQYAYVHHRRMSFTDDGRTDSIEYMHAVWKKGEYLKHTKLRII